MSNCYFHFTTKNSDEPHKIINQFEEIGNISNTIFSSLMLNPKYEIPFSVDSSVLKTFIQYLNGEYKTPEIHVHELSQYIQLGKHFELKSFLKYINDDKEKMIIDQEKKISELTANVNQLNTIISAQAEEIHKLMESNQLIQSLKEQIGKYEKNYDSLQNEFNQFKERKCNDLSMLSTIGTVGQVPAVNQDENVLSYHEYECLDI